MVRPVSARRAVNTASASHETARPALSRGRIVVKAGTGLLTGGAGRLDEGVMASLVAQVAELRRGGSEMVLVSSGAVAAGRHALGASSGRKGTLARQMLAAVGQSRLMRTYEELFARHGLTVAQALLSRRDLVDRLGYLNVRNTLIDLVDLGVVPIVNENDVVAVEEITGDLFGDNDTLSAMVANLVDADLLVMLGEVEGLFTADPHVDPDARLIPTVERLNEEIESIGGPSWGGYGRGGMAAKLEAARLATASGVDAVIARGTLPGVLVRLLDGESIGTMFPATGTKMESRKRWMMSGLSTRGEIRVDDGAAGALRRQASLLPAGVTDVRGAFDRGDIVSILDARNAQVACGIANYSSSDVSLIRGVRSGRIQGILGRQYGDEVVHRNNMVLV